MVSKIEAAERLAEAVEKCKHDFCADKWQLCWLSLDAYRSASVPSDEELGRVAYEARMHVYPTATPWSDVSTYDKRNFAAAAAAVREWCKRSEFTEDELRRRVDSWCEADGHALTEDERTNLLVTLGLIPKPSPVWEWDDANSMWTLGCKVDGEVFPCAAVSLSEDGGILGRVYFSESKRDHCVVDSYKEACEWCEQQILEARE